MTSNDKDIPAFIGACLRFIIRLALLGGSLYMFVAGAITSYSDHGLLLLILGLLMLQESRVE